jgi:hypothetical protein
MNKKKQEHTLYPAYVNVRIANTLIIWTSQQYAKGHHTACTLKYTRHTGAETQHFKGLWQKYFIPCTLRNHCFCNREWKLTITVRNKILSVSLISSPVCSFSCPSVPNFRVQFGFQVSPQEVLGHKAVRTAGWPGNVTINYNDASGKQGSQTLH